ncbi:ABC transporter permease subunit [Sporichthya polymorpha]|uniref:branched-chain amino acid ABC transporter permease n=1 Tax=Sporichthya polymorpha TaxID=35751 RepID=UPI0012EC68E8|nr:ABC transporter permease [Sporichthya polymorpha]
MTAVKQRFSDLTGRLGYTGCWIAGALLVVIIGAPVAEARNMWPFVLTGISDGAIYSFAALGLVLTFKTSGIFNFAIGAQAAASAYVFYSFRIDAGLSWPLAFLLSLVLVGLLGSFVLERIAFWLEEAPAVMKVVATIGLIVLLQSVLTGAYGTATLQFPPYLSQEQVTIAGTQVLMSQIIVVALALVATIGLTLFFRRNRIGLAMQALVDDPELLASEGTSPITVRRYAWAIGSCFVSISGMLIAPVLGIDVNLMLLLYITAFGAAALGAFDNLAVAFIASIGIGVATNVLGNELAGAGSTWVTGLYTQVPFIALVAALLFVPRARLIERGSKRARKLPPIREFPARVNVGMAVATAALFLMLPQIVAASDLNQFTVGLGFAIVLLSLALLLWSSGQISLCQMAFAAIGASTFAHLQQAGFPWLMCLLLAGLAAVPAGAIVAIPSFRLSGVYLAVATFGFGLLAQNLLYTSGLMFGLDNSEIIARPDLPGLETQGDTGYYYLVVVIAGLMAGLVLMVRRSRLGRILRALADSPAALDAHAVRTKVTRISVFCLSAFVAAIGGALIGGATTGAGGDAGGPFGYFNSLVLIAVLVFCSRRPILGPVLAAFLFSVAKIYPPMDSGFLLDYRGAIFGGLALAVALWPGIRLPQLRERGAERGESSPVSARAHESAERSENELVGATTR